MLAIPGVAICRASPETGTFQVYARLVTSDLGDGENVVGSGKGAYTLYQFYALAFLHPCCFERALAACELRCRTIKQQPMCRGVEYAGCDVLGPGSPIHHRLLHLLSIIFVLAPIMAAAGRPTTTADSRMKMQHWSFFNPLTVTL